MPILTLFLGVPVKTAIGTSLVCVVVTSSASQIVYVARGFTNTRLGMTLEVATTLGALVGGITAILISGRAIFAIFAVVLVYVLISMERRPARTSRGDSRRGAGRFVHRSRHRRARSAMGSITCRPAWR